MNDAAVKRIYLHIGLHKTGTTYLQNIMRANRDGLGAQGFFFPGGPDTPLVQMLAVWDLLGRRRRRDRDQRISGQWRSMTDSVTADPHPVALLSEEHFSLATAAQAGRAVSSFPDHEVHVVVTARDLGRILVSAWQEDVKHDQTWTWEEFVAAVRDPRRRGTKPARGFWLRQDLPAILETWASVVPPERIHVVTVPSSGGDPQELLKRFASVVGFDAGLLTREPKWDNQTLGIAGTEVVRRLNALLGHRLNERQYNRVVNATIVRALSRTRGSARLGLPASELAWVRAWAEEATARVEAGGYQVVGDLSELLPAGDTVGSGPDEVSAEELLDAAMTALADLSEHYARAWWSRKRPDVGVDDVPVRERLASAVRGVSFRAQRRASELGDRHPAAGRLMALMLRFRQRPRRRTLSR